MVLTTAGFGNTELLQIADAVAREKQIDKEVILEAMEQAIQVAGRRKYGHEHDIRAEIHRKTGEVKLYRVRHVVEEIQPPEVTEEGEIGEDVHSQILLEDARQIEPDIEVGGEIRELLPPIDFGRIAAQTAKQVIMQRVRDAERDQQFEEFKDRVGEIVNGTVKRIEYNNVTVDLGRAEGFLHRDHLIAREQFRVGDRLRCFVADVRRERTGPQIFLSRTDNRFMAALFRQEVPEVYDGIIEIKAVARDPGFRAKIGVYSNDPSIDPVGSCVGVRGSRVQAVVNELQGERVDIIPWSEDPAVFVVNALIPAEVTKVVIDEDNDRVEVVVPDDQLSLAIGRRGQNVRLASQLTGWEIDVMTDDEESQRRSDEFRQRSELFVEALNVEEVMAHLLVAEGFTTVEEVAYVPVSNLATIEGFDEEIAEELRRRAREWMESQQESAQENLIQEGVDASLFDVPGLVLEWVPVLKGKGVLSRDDLADLATDEFQDMFGDLGLSDSEVETLIMNARAHWFNEDEAGQADSVKESA